MATNDSPGQESPDWERIVRESIAREHRRLWKELAKAETDSYFNALADDDSGEAFIHAVSKTVETFTLYVDDLEDTGDLDTDVAHILDRGLEVLWATAAAASDAQQGNDVDTSDAFRELRRLTAQLDAFETGRDGGEGENR